MALFTKKRRRIAVLPGTSHNGEEMVSFTFVREKRLSPHPEPKSGSGLAPKPFGWLADGSPKTTHSRSTPSYGEPVAISGS